MNLFDTDERFLQFCQAFQGLTNSQCLQDLFALYCQGPKPGYFLEFGIANGSRLSNTLLLELMGWKGLGGEPNPMLREKASRRRSAKIVGEALYHRSGDTLSFECNGLYGGLAETSDLRQTEARCSYTQTIEVDTISLKDLLCREQAPKAINYFSLDIEGAEEMILKELPVDEYSFHCVTVEHNNGPRRRSILNLMKGHGFQRVFKNLSGHDDWYINSQIKFRGWPLRLLRNLDNERGSLHLAKCLGRDEQKQEQAIANLYSIIYTRPKPHQRSFIDLATALRRSGRAIEAQNVIVRGLEIYPENERMLKELKIADTKP